MSLQIENKREIGVRELHNRTSEVIKLVAAGEALTVTNHGKPIARLVPIQENDPVEVLRRQGLIRDPLTSDGPLDPPLNLKAGRPISDYISEQRR